MHLSASNGHITQPSATPLEPISRISFVSNQELVLQATVVRLTPQSVVFEVYNPAFIPRFSDVLTDFRFLSGDRVIYNGKAVVSSVINAGAVTICEATLTNPWLGAQLLQEANSNDQLRDGFKVFLQNWHKFYQILPEYKLVVADMQNHLHELQSWLNQVELGVQALAVGARNQKEREIIEGVIELATPTISSLFERFETIAATVPAEMAAAHFNFCRRQLHPLLLGSPFMHRIYAKPLGYAGDYEMVNMILRDPFEGGSLFFKLLNVFILRQVPAAAHRNRVRYLVSRLIEETGRVVQAGRKCQVYNLGCGPAGEVQEFLTEHNLCDSAEFTLLDMSDETLKYTGCVLEGIKNKYHRRTPIKLVKKSVHNLVKQAASTHRGEGQYDFIYSAGLFDYLSDRVCKTIIGLGYEQLLPGGLLLVTNVDSSNPIRNIMEHIYEWHLIYRSGRQFGSLASDLPAAAQVNVRADITSGNIFMEVRKPHSTL